MATKQLCMALLQQIREDTELKNHRSVPCSVGHYDWQNRGRSGVIVANRVLGCEVDERSVFGVGEVGFVIDRLGKVVYITQVQVPPRPPKKTDDLLIICLFSLTGLERAAPVADWCKKCPVDTF